MDLLTTIRNMISGCVEWVWDFQNPDGGLPSDKEGSMSCTWTTSGLLWALWSVGERFDDPRMMRALKWVLNNKNSDYGIPIVVQGDPSITDATAQTLIACSLALNDINNEQFKGGVGDCIRWLLYHHLKKSGWNWKPSDEKAWSASTAFAILGLHYSRTIFSEPNNDVSKAVEEATDWLKLTQNADGGWGAYEGDRSRAAITGLISSVLSEVCEEFDFTSAINFILSQQLPDGSWADTIDRPTGHTVTRIGPAYCLRALARCGYSLHSREFLSGISALIRVFDRRRFRYLDTDILSWPTRDYLLTLAVIGNQLMIPSCRRFGALTRTMNTGTIVSSTNMNAIQVHKMVDLSLVNILHISDIHRGHDAPTSNTSLIGKLLDDIKITYGEDNATLNPQEPKLAAPDLIIVSGDITQRASTDEFELALRFLDGLLELVNGNRKRIVLVPGNHDVNWALSAQCFTPATKDEFERQPLSGEPYKQSIKRAPDGTYWRKNDAIYTNRFKPFKDFFDEFYQGDYTYSLSREEMFTIFDHSNELGLIVVGFNSCDEIDAYNLNGQLESLDRRAFINTDAIYNAENNPLFHSGEKGLIRIGVFHHNIRSVNHGMDFLDPKYLRILKRHGFDLCLHGHVHIASHDLFDSTQARVLPVVGAGSLAAPYSDRPPAAPMGYNLVVVDRQSRDIWVHTRRHDEDHLTWEGDYRWNGKSYFLVRP